MRILGLFIFLFSFLANADTGRIKNEIEAGFDLTKSAAARALKTYKFKAKNRMDFYVDIYDGKDLVLMSQPMRQSFRLQVVDGGKRVFQTNIRTKVTLAQCAGGLSFTIKEKSSGELSVTDSEVRSFSEDFVNLLDSLKPGAQPQVAQALKAFHSKILSLPVPLMQKLTQAPSSANWYFTPSYTTEKVKWEADYFSDGGRMEIAVAEARDFVGRTFIQDKYEIEFEPKGKMTVDGFKKAVCEVMEQLQFTGDELNPDKSSAPAETLRRLKTFNGALGL